MVENVRDLEVDPCSLWTRAKWFLGIKSTLGKEAEKTGDDNTKKWNITNSGDKAEAVSERTGSNFEDVLLWVICHQPALHATEQHHRRKSQLIWQH